MKSSSKIDFRWAFGHNSIISLISIISTIVLLKFIDPFEYGQLGMVMPLFLFWVIFNSFATSNSIVSRKDLNQDELSSLFWMKLSVSVVLIFITLLLAHPIAKFYKTPELLEIINLYCGVLLPSGVNFLYHGLLYREKQFSSLAISDIVSSLIANVIAIYLAYYDYGIYSLIVREYTNLVLVFTIRVIYCRWLPSFVFKPKLLKYHVKFGANVCAEGILNFGSRNIDDILVGRTFGSNSLGLYTKSFGLLLMPTQLISKVILTILLPKFSRLQAFQNELVRIYLKAKRLVIFTTSLLCTLLFFTIEDVFFLLNLENWYNLIPMIRIFVVLAILQSIGPLQDLIYQGTNRTNELLKYGIYIKSYQIGIIFLSISLAAELLEFVIYFSIFNSLSVFLSLYFLGLTVKVKFKTLIKNLLPPLITTLLSAFILYIFLDFIDCNFIIINLALKVAIITITILLIYRLLYKDNFNEWLNYVKLVLQN